MKRFFSQTLILSLLLALAFSALGGSTARADGLPQVSLVTLGTPYTQNFDTLSKTAGTTTNLLVIDGWYLIETGGGARDNEQYAVDTGASGTGDIYSYGAASATDRALGGLSSGTLIPTYGASFTNYTGYTIDTLAISYVGEEWRLGFAGRTDRLDFQYSLDATTLTNGSWTDVNALDFTTPDATAPTGAKDGNAAGYRTSITSTLSGLNIPNGATFWIRWNDSDASNADDGLAVDDFSLAAYSCQHITVMNNADSGAGSLRQAIADVCAGGTITFDETVFSTAQTITLASSLAIVRDVTIDGSTVAVPPTIGNNTSVTIFNITGGNVTLDGLVISDGRVGIFYTASGKTLTLRNSTVSDNVDYGMVSLSAVNVHNSVFVNNHTTSDGGAIMAQGAMTITNSVFLNNSASVDGGAISVRGTATIVNSTFTGNTAGQGGGAIVVYNTATIINSTLSGNSVILSAVNYYYGDQLFINGGTLHLYNTILANGPNGADCRKNSGTETVDGTNNLIQKEMGGSYSCSPGTTNPITGQSPLVGALGDYGGSTQTTPLLPGSPAIDAGNDTACANAVTVNNLDQRGIARSQGTHCDIGAFESQGFTLAKTGGDNQSTAVNADFALPLTLSVASAFSEPVDGGLVTFTAPDSGASASIDTSPATISSGGVSVDAAANGMAGGYNVTATASGADSVNFSLTNTPLLDLGDMVWLDNGAGGGVANDGTRNGTESGVSGVTVELYRDVNGNDLPEPGGADGAALDTKTTNGAGRYLFTGLMPGSYFVRIPSEVFQSGGALFGMFSTVDSTPAGQDPDNDLNEDALSFNENGVDNSNPALNGVNTLSLTLALGTEPTNDGDVNSNSNLAVDLGFITAPAAFGKTSPSNNATGVSTSPTLSWNASSGQTDYEYCYDTAASGACAGTWASTSNTTSANLSGLSHNTTYRWQVRAVDNGLYTEADSGSMWNFTTSCVSSVTVISNADSGAGSLRQAIAEVCADGTVGFAPALSGQTITLTSGELGINKSMTIDGVGLASQVIVSGNNSSRVFYVNDGVTFNLQNLTVANGNVPMHVGGGIYIPGNGVVTVNNSTFSGNHAYNGGGIYNYNGDLTVTNSAFFDNYGDGGGGGGIYNYYRNTTVINSSFSANHAAYGGGGIFSEGNLWVANSTFSANYAGDSGSSVFFYYEATFKNTIIANSASGNSCAHYGGAITDGGGNLEDGATCGFNAANGSLSNTDPWLGTFGNYGGSTNTFPLLPGSPAIYAGNAATCAAAPVNSLDQRGVTRPAACDIGAFESQGFTLTKTGGDDQSTIVNTAFSNPLEVTVTSAHSEPVDGGQVTFAPQGLTANASVTGSPATIGTVTSGKASVTAAANGTAGGYNVTASAAGATDVNFALANFPACSSAITVTNNTDHDAGSLRQAIAGICPGGTITFAGDTTIALASTLTIDKNLTIDGTGYDVTISGDTNGDDTGDVRVFQVNSGVTANLNSLTITRGYALNSVGVGGAGGGGIYNYGTLTVANSALSYNTVAGENGNGGAIDSDWTEGILIVSNTIFRGNSAYDGGAIQQGAELTITDSTFVENTSSWSGGAINCNSGSLPCTISGSTFSSNTNTGDTYGGGAIAFFNNGVKTVANSTFTGNISTTDGGAIYAFTGTVNLDSVTIAGNTTQNGDGGGLASSYSTTLISNTIIANNLDNGGGAPDCSGGISSGGYNLIKNLTGCAFTPVTGDITGVDPRLGSLGDYGGSTETLPLLPSSPAIDAGSSCAVADQRGVTRPTACDIGAFESQGFTLTKTGGDNQSTAVNTDFGAPLTLSVTSAFGEPVNGGQVTFTVPGSGASASITSSPYTISSGVVSVDAAANGIVGGYNVNASAGGANSVDFVLRNMGTPVITWASPANIVYGTPLGATQLNATADLPGAFTYTPASGAVLNVGTHTLHVDFTPTDTTNYANASKDVSISVTQAAPVITWANPANIVYGTPLGATQLNATANVPGTFAYTPDTGAILDVGTHTLHVDFTPADTLNYTNASREVSITVTPAAPVINWAEPADIVYGTPLSDTQLNASADVPGAFTYIPASGAVLNVGTHILHVDFVPTDTVNYTNAAKDVSLTVLDVTAPAVLSVTRVDPSPTDLFSVNFTVIFSEPVSGVDVTGPDFDDFSLDTFGLTDPLITAVTPVSETEYTVTVDTGSGNGTLGLNVLATGAIVDASNNPLNEGFTGGEVYQVLKSAIFADVPNEYWANDFIERLYLSRITGGCGVAPLIYCPNQGVTRAQLAVFLLRAKYGAPYLPPEVGAGTDFNDVSTDHWAAAWIKQLAAEGITGGCGNGNFCPDKVVTRAELAVMLLRAEHGNDYIPPAASGLFSDVPADHWAAAWIEQLVAEGITGGCGGNNYCPTQPVTRAQIAVFLVAAFNLP